MSSRPIIHGRDHTFGATDPVFHAWEDVGGGAAGSAWVAAFLQADQPLAGSSQFDQVNLLFDDPPDDQAGSAITLTPGGTPFVINEDGWYTAALAYVITGIASSTAGSVTVCLANSANTDPWGWYGKIGPYFAQFAISGAISTNDVYGVITTPPMNLQVSAEVNIVPTAWQTGMSGTAPSVSALTTFVVMKL